MLQKEGTRRLFLVFHGRFPSEKAASLFAAKSAEAFAAKDISVTLLAPRRLGRVRTDYLAYYTIRHPFNTVFLPTIDLIGLKFLQDAAFRLSLLIFSKWTFFYLLFHASKQDIIYSAETLPLLFASLRFPHTCIEIHDYPERALWFYRILFKRVSHIVVTTQWKLERLKKDFPGCVRKTFYEPNAVSVEDFSLAISKEEARKKLSLPLKAKLVVYTGHLYAWKGVDTLAEAAKHIDADIYIVGGTEKDIARFKKKWRVIPNLRVVGHKPYEEMPLWQKAADVLVLPNTRKEEISVHYTSPMKLFEYMASGTPVVASDIPSIREIAGDGRALLVTPDDPEALADGIRRVVKGETAGTTERAREWIQEHTWGRRMERILQAIE